MRNGKQPADYRGDASLDPVGGKSRDRAVHSAYANAIAEIMAEEHESNVARKDR